MRVRSRDEDPIAIHLSKLAATNYPPDAIGIDALLAAVKVASAWGWYATADDLCDQADRLNAMSFAIPDNRRIELERLEFEFWSTHQRTATARRRVDAGDVSPLRRGLELVEQQHRILDELLAIPGDIGRDASEKWAYWALTRQAELLLGVPEEHGRRRERLGAAERLVQAAETVATDNSFGAVQMVPTIKARLQLALAQRDTDEAVERLQDLAAVGWPMHRSVPTVAAALDDSVNSTLPGVVLDAAVHLSARENAARLSVADSRARMHASRHERDSAGASTKVEAPAEKANRHQVPARVSAGQR